MTTSKQVDQLLKDLLIHGVYYHPPFEDSIRNLLGKAILDAYNHGYQDAGFTRTVAITEEGNCESN